LSVAVEFAPIDWRGRSVRIEYQWIGVEQDARPIIVFLHEGLGSLSAWRDFPQALCAAVGCRGLVYSRPGYGRSTARSADEHWGVDYLHRQALEVLPALLSALHIDNTPLRLFGHSDGASIALLHAAEPAHRVHSAVLLAPHLFVEPVSIASIEAARAEFKDGDDLRQRLSRHHDDVDSAFWGWNDAWLNPAFRSWNIEAALSTISCPLLGVQGLDDTYGTLQQVYGIQRELPAARVIELADCGHSPHRDQPAAVIAACLDFWADDRGGTARR
jgi:pimeloyl-ACP methyl ester carboxylesterase